MIRIAITEAAFFEAIAATLPLGSSRASPTRERMIWLDARVVDKLTAMRRPSEDNSEVILRLVEIEAESGSDRRAGEPHAR